MQQGTIIGRKPRMYRGHLENTFDQKHFRLGDGKTTQPKIRIHLYVHCTDNKLETQQADDREVEYISLLDSLEKEWIKLPFVVMRDVGPAVQTLGGLIKVTMKETYSPVDDIAAKALLPVGTVRKHLVTLHDHGWIDNRGREQTRRGMPRRTCTIAVTKKTKDHLARYGILPWWACCNIRKVGKLPWSAKVLLALLMGRLCSLKGTVEKSDQADDDMEDVIENMGEHFQFSLTHLVRQTGLTRESVVIAKKWLHKHKIICWSGRNNGIDILSPNWDFAVVITPATPGHIWLDFGHKEG